MSTDTAFRPDPSSPVWDHLAKSGLDKRDQFISSYDEISDPKHRRSRGGIIGFLGLTKDHWVTLSSKFTDVEISRAFGTTQAAIRSRRKRLGIGAKTTRQRRDERANSLNLDDLTPGSLRNLLESMPLYSVAKMYGVSPPAIRYRCKRWNIHIPSKSERATSSVPFSEDQKHVIIGMLLGDGSILEDGRFKVTHGHNQFNYLLATNKILRPVSRPISYHEKIGHNGTWYHEFTYRTDIHPWLKEQRKIWYPGGSRERVFPESVLRNLSDLSLAYWYMDDGHYDGIPSFALGKVGPEQAQKVSQCVAERFGFDAYVKPGSENTNCAILCIRASSSENFFKRVSPHVCPDLLYKVPRRYWPDGFSPRKPLQERDKDLFPNTLVTRSKDWEDLNDVERESHLNDLVRYWRERGFPYTEPRVRDLSTLVNLDHANLVQGDILRPVQVGQSSVTSFQPTFWETASRGPGGSPKQTPFDHFNRDDKLRSILIRCMEAGHVPNAPRLRSFLGHGAGVSNFRPATAKALVDRFCPDGGTVWDPCAGWGGRLLGAVCSGRAVRYLACEPNTETYDGLNRLVGWAGEYLPAVKERVELHNVPCEDFDPPKGIDLILTSPPYYNKEVYSTEETQSTVRYPSYGQWIENFLFPLVSRSFEKLSPGGWLVLNISDVKSDGTVYPLVEDVSKIAKSLCFGDPQRLKYEIPSAFGENRYEKVLCWCKTSDRLPDAPYTPVLGLSKCRSCGDIVSREDIRDGVCPSCESKENRCVRCGADLAGSSVRRLHCESCRKALDAERAREKRLSKPKNDHRETRCIDCGEVIVLGLTGGVPKRCPTCKGKHEQDRLVRSRTKVCAYRECGGEFVDDNDNKSKFCCEEHRRREKMFRTGKVTSPCQFRLPDPVLDEDPKPKFWTCRVCGERFEKIRNDRRNRCPTCLDKARNKTCRKCMSLYHDNSVNNTRRYCYSCRPGDETDPIKSVECEWEPQSQASTLPST